MELENLRTIWRVSMERIPARAQHDEEIRALLGKRSQGLVAKMKRNLFGELILVLCIYIPGILFYLFGFGGKLSEMGGVLVLLTAFFAAYYYRKNKLLNDMQCPSCAVRSNLDRQVTTLQKYIRFYTIAGTVLVPVMAVFSFLVTSRSFLSAAAAPVPWFLTDPHDWKTLWVCAVVLVSVTIVSYYANVWHMNRLYGRHIKKLRQLLEEMTEE
jgi:drug/metabolite transporter (DMT)-like permease